MLFDAMTRFDVHRTEPEVDVAEDATLDVGETGGADDDGGSVGATETGGRSQRNAQAAQRRVTNRAAQERKELAELRAWKQEVAPDLEFLRSLRTPQGQTAAEDVDLFEPDGRRKFGEDITQNTISEMEKRLEARRQEEQAQRSIEQERVRFQARAEALAPIAAERTRVSEVEFAADRGLVINPDDPDDVVESEEDGSWNLEKWNKFIDFIKQNQRRFFPSGKFGEYTKRDYEEAEYAFDKGGVIKRIGSRSQEDILNHLNPRAGQAGQRRGADPSSHGEGPPRVDANRLDKLDHNPFGDENDFVAWLKTAPKASEVRKVKAFLREKYPDFLEMTEREVAYVLARNTQTAFTPE